LDAGFELPSFDRAVLARCLLVDGHYARAAENYRTVLSRGLVLHGDNARHNDELAACLYVATADAFNKAHDAAAAKALLRECLDRHPKHAEAYRQLAELYAGETDYTHAYEVLDQWADKQPELDADIWVRTLRALGRVEKPRDWRRVLDEFFNNHPERLEAVSETVDSLWGVFKALGEESRKEWLYGCFRLWWTRTAPVGTQ
jgi:tetratricopeptide (TPR) repeat protein